MNLSTRYLGLTLPHPLIPGASPLADDLDTVRRLEDAGAAAIILRSLFEEQITREQVSAFLHSEMHGESFAEALTYFPTPQSFVFGPEEYLEHLGRVKAAVKIPVIASLNGTTPDGWLDYPPLIESTGASRRSNPSFRGEGKAMSPEPGTGMRASPGPEKAKNRGGEALPFLPGVLAPPKRSRWLREGESSPPARSRASSTRYGERSRG